MVSHAPVESVASNIFANVANSSIGIGFGDGFTHVGFMPGWLRGSWGYHSDDGKKFSESGSGEDYAETFGRGDVVGCGIDNGAIYFTKNGRHLGKVSVLMM